MRVIDEGFTSKRYCGSQNTTERVVNTFGKVKNLLTGSDICMRKRNESIICVQMLVV